MKNDNEGIGEFWIAIGLLSFAISVTCLAISLLLLAI